MKRFLRVLDIPKDYTGTAFACDARQTRILVNGKLHNLTGPASIWYNSDMTINSQTYYIEGTRILYKEDFWNHPMVLLNKLEGILCL